VTNCGLFAVSIISFALDSCDCDTGPLRMNWGLHQDSANASLVLETFVVESWAEYQPQHERITVEDRVVEEAVPSSTMESGPR
jgi:Transmembrane secretion effector